MPMRANTAAEAGRTIVQGASDCQGFSGDGRSPWRGSSALIRGDGRLAARRRGRVPGTLTPSVRSPVPRCCARESFHARESRRGLWRDKSPGQLREIEPPFHLLPLAPVVVGVAFEAGGFDRLSSGMMALLAKLDSRKEDIACFLTGHSASVTTGASHQAVLVVVEHGMSEPALCNI